MKLFLTFAFLLFTSPAWSLSLEWATVSTDIDGQPLSAGNEVTGYKVYGCQSNNCTPANAAFIATVPVEVPQKPQRTFDITGLPKPQTYFVTAINLSAESGVSNKVRVTPASGPGSLIVIP